MKDKELKKLNRAELLELLVEQGRKNEQLQAQLDEANRKLEERAIAIDSAGSIAEASLNLSGIFQAAEEAAKQYLENIERLSGEQEQVCARMEEESRKRARAMLIKTETRCRAREQEADEYCSKVTEKLQKLSADHEGLQQLLQSSIKIADAE